MPDEPNTELSSRERELLERVATGATNQQIALALDISVNTVKAHLRNIFGKLGVESRTEATRYAIEHGLVQLDQAEGVTGPEAKVTSVEPAEAPRVYGDVREAPAGVLRDWPLGRGQGLALLAALLVVTLVAVWPVRGITPAAKPAGRLVDIPAASQQTAATASVARWLPRAPLPTPRGRFATATIEHEIYVIGGLTGEGWSDRVEVYDAAQDIFSRRAPLPLAVANVGAAVAGGRIYVPGGLTADDALSDRLQVYDPAADAWSDGPPLPQPLCAYAIAPYGEGFYLFGGWDGERYLDTVYYYDAAALAWRAEAPLRAPRGFAAAVTVDDRLYLLGGYDGQTEYALCESYNPTAYAAGHDPWLTHSPMRDGRAGHSAALVEGNLYVVGGGWDRPLRANERYDPRNDVWATFPSPITGQWRTLGLAAAKGQQGAFLYAIGGWDGAAYLASVHAYQASFRVFLP